MARRIATCFYAFKTRSLNFPYRVRFLLVALLLTNLPTAVARLSSHYELTIEAQEQAAQDGGLTAAERAVKEADELVSQHKKELLPTAMAKYQEALSLSEASIGFQTKATLLNKIAK